MKEWILHILIYCIPVLFIFSFIISSSISYCRIIKIQCDGTGVWFQKCSTTHSNILIGEIVLTLLYCALLYTPLFPSSTLFLLFSSTLLYSSLLSSSLLFDLQIFLFLKLIFLLNYSHFKYYPARTLSFVHTHTYTHSHTRTYLQTFRSFEGEVGEKSFELLQVRCRQPLRHTRHVLYCTYTLPFFLHFYRHWSWSLHSYYNSFFFLLFLFHVSSLLHSLLHFFLLFTSLYITSPHLLLSFFSLSHRLGAIESSILRNSLFSLSLAHWRRKYEKSRIQRFKKYGFSWCFTWIGTYFRSN